MCHAARVAGRRCWASVLARAHQSLIWTRQRQCYQLRSGLREDYRGALDAFSKLASSDALAVLAAAPTPGARSAPVEIQDRLSAANRQTPAPHRRTRHRDPQRPARSSTPGPADGHRRDGRNDHRARRGHPRADLQIDALEADLEDRFDQHPASRAGPLGCLAHYGRGMSRRIYWSPAGCHPSRISSRRKRSIDPKARRAR